MESENRMRGGGKAGREEREKGRSEANRESEGDKDRAMLGGRERWRERWDVEGWSRAAAG